VSFANSPAGEAIVVNITYDAFRTESKKYTLAFQQSIIDVLGIQPNSVLVSSYGTPGSTVTTIHFDILARDSTDILETSFRVQHLFHNCSETSYSTCPAKQPLLDAFAANGLPATQAWYNEAPAPSSQGRRALLNATSSDTLVTQFCTCTDGWSGEYCYGHDSSTQSPVSKHLPAH
jgi:hypothetical protein